ncbi:hypothetical protein NIES4071_14920 [Calothrix sp. NIES-4071]|nr:hypothetical protein NIES4071_14920 [Calothrix sp. NIES-4071]BAZ55829.1 hypothetical protein NIES4105_14870 [Calothrix sp. NIES-4105]
MQKRCDRNRKRSKRRAIYCPIHKCYLRSVSTKEPLLAAESQLQSKGRYLPNILTLLASETTALIQDEWLEAFWCDKCRETKWYRVKKIDVSDAQRKSARICYEVSVALRSDWQQSINAISLPESLKKASLSARI